MAEIREALSPPSLSLCIYNAFENHFRPAPPEGVMHGLTYLASSSGAPRG